MKIEDLHDLYPFENYATFDKIRKMKWCNNTFVYAIEYKRVVLGEQTDYDKIMQSIGSIDTIIALIYGALKAANDKIDISNFGRIYKGEHLKEYIEKVLEGVKMYHPEPEIKYSDDDLDEGWPDTQGELKKKVSTKRQTGASGTGSRKKRGSATKNSGSSPKEP